MLTKRIISILLIAMFILPVEAIRATSYIKVDFNFTDYTGVPLTYTVGAVIFDENGTSLGTVWSSNPTKTLEPFKSYKMEITLYDQYPYKDGNEINIIRTFKTRAGYKKVNIKLPSKPVVEWKLNLQQYAAGEKWDYGNNYTSYVELYKNETNDFVKSGEIIAGKATLNVQPNTYNVIIKGQEFEQKTLSNFPIYKDKTSNITINVIEYVELRLIFNKPLKYKAQLTADQSSSDYVILPAGTENYTLQVQIGKPFNIQILFGVYETALKKQGIFEKQYTLNDHKTVRLWEFNYAKYDDQKEYLPVDICSTNSGDKEVTLTDPVYKTTISQNKMIGASCIRASGENGQDIKLEKWTRINIKVYNKETGKKEERTIAVKNTNQIVFGNSNSTSAMDKVLTVNVYEAGTGINNTTPTAITNWTGTIRRISDGEFVGTRTSSDGSREIKINNNQMIYIPDESEYELIISANGFMEEVKRFRAFGPKTINVYMTRSSQMKPVTINLETVSDNKGLIIKDIYMNASYYYNDETGTLQKDTVVLGEDQIPIEAIVSSTATKWVFTVKLPENKSVYLSPVISYESGASSFTYEGRPQKHTITPLSTSSSQEINMPINIIGTNHKILVIEKQSSDKNIVDNIPVTIAQLSYANDQEATMGIKSYGVKNFQLKTDSISPDQAIWLPDGIFIQVDFEPTGEIDIYKYKKKELTEKEFYQDTSYAKSQKYKTPLQYDKTKYSMPAIIASFQKSIRHVIGLRVRLKIIEENPYDFQISNISYDLRKAVFTIKSKDGTYKDSSLVPGWLKDVHVLEKYQAEWIVGLPEKKDYEATLTLPYKVKTGDRNILNSKGEVWKTVPTYEYKKLVFNQHIDQSGENAGALVEFIAKLSPNGNEIKAEDKSDTIPFQFNDCKSYAVHVLEEQNSDGENLSELWCMKGNLQYAEVLPANSGCMKFPRCTEIDWWSVDGWAICKAGAIEWVDSCWNDAATYAAYGAGWIKIIKAKSSKISKMFNNSLAFITLSDTFTTHTLGSTESKAYSPSTSCASIQIDKKYDGQTLTEVTPWCILPWGEKRITSTTTNDLINTSTVVKHKPLIMNKTDEKMVTIRLRNKNPEEVFSLSSIYIDPSKRDTNNDLIKTYKNTYVEFQETDSNGDYTNNKFKKVWIDNKIASQYQKTWVINADPDKELWIKVMIPNRISGDYKEIIQKVAAGKNVTAEIEYESDYTQPELTAGTKYEVTGNVSVDYRGTITAYVASGTGINLKISGMKCDNDNKECYDATKAIIDKIKNSGSNPNSRIYVKLDSLTRDNYGALSGRLYIDDTDVASDLAASGLIVNVKPETDKDAYSTYGTKNIIVKARAGNNASFTGKKVYVAINPDSLPTMRKITQGSNYDAYAYWGGIEHELQIDPSDPTSTKETTIKIGDKIGDNVKLLFYTSDLKSFIEKTWMAQLIKQKTEATYKEIDKAIGEMVSEEMERSSYQKEGSFSTAVKNVSVTAANYQYVNVTIPQLGASTYTDYKTITVNIHATSTGGFRANLIDLSAAASIVGTYEAKKSAINKFKEKTYQQINLLEWAPNLAGDQYQNYENSRYKITYYKDTGIWKSTIYDKVDMVEIDNTTFTNNSNKNIKLIKTWEKWSSSGIMKTIKAMTLQPFTKWLGKAFSALGSWGEAAYRWAIVTGMGLPLSGMPLLKIQTSMESKNGVMEATNASTSFQVQDWFRNYFNKPLVAKTTTVQIKARKYGKVIVRMAAMGHEPYTAILTVNDTVWTNESLDVYASMKTNLTYSYTNFETFMNSFPLLQERIEEFALTPEMYATSSERGNIIDYIEEGIRTMMESFIKDFTPFMQDNGTGTCDQYPWLPECGSFGTGGTTG